jgi:hypothetical protein
MDAALSEKKYANTFDIPAAIPIPDECHGHISLNPTNLEDTARPRLPCRTAVYDDGVTAITD